MTHPRPMADPAAGDPGLQSALLGHDLRAAVSDVIGGLRLIDHETLDPAMRIQLERVRAAGETLARLMEEALTTLPGEEDAQEVQSANLHLPRLLYDAEMRWSGRAREKGLGFGLTVAPGVPQVVAVNRIALERILSNVLANAIKYTDAGSVEVQVFLDGDALVFRVRDAGPGFCDAALQRLFEPGGRPGEGARPGSGLGLHIAKEMADRMGGEVTVTNRPESGAEVTLRLPAAAWTPAQEGAAPPGLPDLSEVKVLLAEDNETNQMLIGGMLARMGAEYVVASDGVEALNWLDREVFDLALIDIEMPRLNGIEVMRALRARGGAQARLPVLAVTAYVLRANREAIYAAGADRILAKPIGTLEGFGQAIAKVLDMDTPPEAGAEEPAAEALAGKGAPAGPDIDPDHLRHLIAISGPEGAPELLRRLLADLRAVERALVGALPQTDCAEIRAQTHVLIALAGAVGGNRLAGLARILNDAVHRRDTGALARHGGELLERLDDLIHFVATQTPPEMISATLSEGRP